MDLRKCLDLADAIIAGSPADDAILEELACMPEQNVFDILPGAHAIRQHFFGARVHLCCIANGKSGKCSEDCAFCSQSAHAKTNAPIYPLMGLDQIRQGAVYARENGIHRYSLVTSGGRLPKSEVQVVSESFSRMAETGVDFCASLGTLDARDFSILKQAGVTRYHHNLETAESHFSKICTTHTYGDRVRTVMEAKMAGMSVCSGGLFGIGETDLQVLELGLALRNLDVDSVPVNFLISIPGTRLGRSPGVSPLRCLKIIALLRYVLGDKEIVICGGRTANLGELHPLVFYAGASGIMTGNYLTAPGRNPGEDQTMISALGLTTSASPFF
ncbi:MAG: biotin synthase BioB [Desulfatibacillum sp.]|nr:biotin synthase BioB [Desulfatibacillum sp.]